MSEPVGLRPIHILKMILLGAIWGASFLFMRVAVAEFGPIALIEVRVLIGGVFLLVVALVQNRHRELLRSPGKLAIVGFTNSAFPYTLFAWGLKVLSAGLESVINATSPFFGAIIGVVFLRELITPRKWLGLSVGFLGVCALVASNQALEGSLTGMLACLVAAGSYGVAAHYTKRQLAGVSGLAIATGSQLAAAVMLIPLAIAAWPAQCPSPASWAAATALGILCTGGALVLYFDLLNAIGAMRAMSVGYLIPLFGVLWGWLFLSEAITVWIIIGAALILFGLFIFSSRPGNARG